MLQVDVNREVGILLTSEDGRGLSVGVDQREVCWFDDIGSVRGVDFIDVAQEEGALGLLEGSLESAECEDAELE